jgi:hypothetical protein
MPVSSPLALPTRLGETNGVRGRTPSPFPLPQWGRGLRRVGEAQPSLTRSWVRGTPAFAVEACVFAAVTNRLVSFSGKLDAS